MNKKQENNKIPLSNLAVGKEAVIESADMPVGVRLRLSDLGMNKGARIVCLGKSPLGDPRAYLVRDRVIAIRGTDAKNIICKIQ